MSSRLHIHGFVADSRANGPGRRFVIWTQGCSLGCPGCFNPRTHSRSSGQSIATDILVEQIVRSRTGQEGVTISGGEPLEQFESVRALVEQVRAATDLSILMFTGFAWPEVQCMPRVRRLLDSLDVLLCGRYDQTRRLAEGLRGSANKTVHLLTPRYTTDDLQTVPLTEVMISPTGEILATGIDPLSLS